MDVAEILGSKNLELPLAAPVEDATDNPQGRTAWVGVDNSGLCSMEVGVKVCRDCHEEKPVTEFYRTRKGRGVDPSCKSCRMEEARVRRRRQSEERRQARIESRTSDKEVKFGIEMGGRRVWVCQDCLRRYLKG